MEYAILLIIALILISGFIAYFGDLLGRKMGKKRLSLFGMRPRFTAIVVTTITGMVISAVALTTLLIIDSQFRKVLTEGKQILAQNQHLTSLNSILETTNDKLSKLSEKLEDEVKKRESEVKIARLEAKKALNERNKAVASVVAMKREIDIRQKELAELRKNSAITKEALETKIIELRKVQTNLTNAKQKLNKAQARLNATQKTLAEQELLLIKQKEKLLQQQAQLIQLGKENLEFERQAIDMHTQALELRSGELVLRQGDELVRQTIKPTQSEFGVRADLFSLLQSASAKAAKLGAGNGPNGRAVTVIYRQQNNENTALLAQDDSVWINMAAQTIYSSTFNKDVFVQVVCVRNTLAGEPVPVELKLYVNNKVYSNGDLIASSTADGSQSEARILLALIDFLQTKVSLSAIRAGVIPVPNPDPHSNLGSDPRVQVEGLMSVVDRIKAMNIAVEIKVYASEDIYAAGPLNMENLRFEITGAK